MYLDGIFWIFLFICVVLLQRCQKYEKDVTTLDYLLCKISFKIDTSHLNQQPTMDLTMAPCHCSPLEPPDLQVKAALMEAEVEAVTDGDRNRGGGGGGTSYSNSGGGRQQQGQATINNMQQQSAAVATAVGGGGGERQRTKTTTAAAIAALMAEELVVATAAMVAIVAEAMAVETERQNSRAGILPRYYLWPMSYVEQYYLANSGNILASFLASACANKLFAKQIWILALGFVIWHQFGFP